MKKSSKDQNVKARNFVAKHAGSQNRASTHKNKKKLTQRGVVKHKKRFDIAA